MAKNKVFRRRYVIEVKGITTNDFMTKFLDTTIGKFFKMLAERFAQVDIIMMTAEEIELERGLAALHMCPNCKSQMASPDQDCLFCKAAADNANIKL